MGNTKSNILVIDPTLPMFDRTGGGRRMWEILGLLRRQGHRITYLSRCGAGWPRYGNALEELGIAVFTLDDLVIREADDMASFLSTDGTDRIRITDLATLLTHCTYRAAILSSYSTVHRYLGTIRQLAPDTSVVFDTIDLHSIRKLREAQFLGDPERHRFARQIDEEERLAVACVDVIWTSSEREREIVLDWQPDAAVYAVPVIYPMNRFSIPFAERAGLVFVGSFIHRPNVDGILWFCRSVWPQVRVQIPDLTLTVIGQLPAVELDAFVDRGIKVEGWVESTAPMLSHARLSVAPLLTGAGQKSKIAEAMAAGLPVVTTSIGAEGMGLRSGSNCMIADDADAFATAVVRVYREEVLWSRLVEGGMRLVEENHSPQSIERVLHRALPPIRKLRIPASHEGDRRKDSAK